MTRVCCEDSVRRAFADADPRACAAWQTGALRQTWLPALHLPWVLDLDVTVKPIYGRQEGAEFGYNPHKPGRPSHTYHTIFVRGLRLVLDVQVRSGKEHSATHSRENLWRVWEGLPKECRPWLVCGDASYGHEGLLAECKVRARFLADKAGTPQTEALIERAMNDVLPSALRQVPGAAHSPPSAPATAAERSPAAVPQQRGTKPTEAAPSAESAPRFSTEHLPVTTGG